MSNWKSPNNNPWDRGFSFPEVDDDDDDKRAVKIVADAVSGMMLLWIVHTLIFWGVSHVLEFGFSVQKISAFSALYILFRVIDRVSIGKKLGQ